ncbi:membrane protein insertion efficiency factor YidD [Candidatus Berkelbacteria bacterium]|nr:membrane protein insertion efficiency factor YidD [Candidatus Berkelbacteria bacterium]
MRLYQRTISFDHGPLRIFAPGGYCQFDPSCSQYMYQAVGKHGTVKGFSLGFWRILRCHPWSAGGPDPIP